MELIPWGLDGNIGDLKIEEEGEEYVIEEVDSLKTMGGFITKEADSMSATKFRMKQGGQGFVDGHEIFTRTKELRREGNIEDTGRW